MKVNNITYWFKIAAACTVDKARWIFFLCPFSYLSCFKLAPCLIEWHPHNYAWEIVQVLHDLCPFCAIDVFRFRSTILIGAPPENPGPGLPAISHVAAWHILPNKQAYRVAITIPAGRFNLYMFPDHVKSHLFCLHNIKLQRFVSWRCIQTIGPPSLVQRPILKNKL